MSTYVISAKAKWLLMLMLSSLELLLLQSGWKECSLLTTFQQGLEPKIGSSNSPSMFPIVCSHVWKTNRASNPPCSITSQSSPALQKKVSEPMIVDSTWLTSAEQQRRLAQRNLCRQLSLPNVPPRPPTRSSQ